MIVSLSQADDRLLSGAGVCIVGAGAAGITLACELDGFGVPVLLLDAGGFKLDMALSDEVYSGSANSRHPRTQEFRRVGFGGTTGIWGGRCVPFDPIDFEPRAHVPESGWPIPYEDVAQHYPRALEYCHAGVFDYSTETALPGKPPTIPGLAAGGDLLHDRIERYSLPTHFGLRHRRQIERSRNVTALLGARVLRLHRGAGGAIQWAEAVDGQGRRRHVRARNFVLAGGGLESTRLLFVSDPDGPGLGNAHDRLGRYYACHFENVCARLVAGPTPVAFDFEKTVDGVYARRKLQFSAQAQRHHRLLNTAFRLHFPNYSDASHGSAVLSTLYLAKSTLIPEYQFILQHSSQGPVVSPRSAHLRNIVRGFPQVIGFAFRWLFKIVLARRKLPYTLIANADGSYPIEFNSEQIPLADSRVTLCAQKDRYGLPRLKLDWRISEADIQAAKQAFRVLREALAQTPECRVEFDEATLDDAVRSAVPVGGHHIGCARMAARPEDGVVDTDCRVFGVPNLYLASAAVFPTNGHANPTLTIVAMAVRLAGHLKRCGLG